MAKTKLTSRCILRPRESTAEVEPTNDDVDDVVASDMHAMRQEDAAGGGDAAGTNEAEPTNDDVDDVVASNMHAMRQGDAAGGGDAAGTNMVAANSRRSQVVGLGVAGATTVGVAGSGGGENDDGNEPSGQGEDRDVKRTRSEDIAEEEEEGKEEPVEEHHERGVGGGDVEGGVGIAPETEGNSFDDEDEGEANEDAEENDRTVRSHSYFGGMNSDHSSVQSHDLSSVQSHDDSVQSYGRDGAEHDISGGEGEIIDLTALTDTDEEKEATSESGEKGDTSNRPLKRQRGGEK